MSDKSQMIGMLKYDKNHLNGNDGASEQNSQTPEDGVNALQRILGADPKQITVGMLKFDTNQKLRSITAARPIREHDEPDYFIERSEIR